MSPKSKGYRFKTRKLFKKKIREKLKPLSYLLHDYKIGNKVKIIIDPSFYKGMPHKRYHGKIGIITGKRGRAYKVKVAERILYIKPEHLMPA